MVQALMMFWKQVSTTFTLYPDTNHTSHAYSAVNPGSHCEPLVDT
jgi:hypothetical protein